MRLESSAGPLPGGYGELLVSSLAVLAVVCVVAWLVVRYGGRWLSGARGQGGVMEVVARLALEPRRSLYVVEVAGKTLLVGTSEMGLSVLSELDGEVVRAELGRRPRGGGMAALVAAWSAHRRPQGVNGAPAAPGRQGAADARHGEVADRSEHDVPPGGAA